MTPAARLAAAAEILDHLDPDTLIDVQLRAWGRANRYAGSKDRRAIADRVYTVIRHKRSLCAHMGDVSGRALVLGSLRVCDGITPEEIRALCEGPHALSPPNASELAHLNTDLSLEGAEGLDWPDWLWEETSNYLGAATHTELNALRARAPLDLRVNTLKGTLPDAKAALQAEGIEASELEGFPCALRTAPNTPITASKPYAAGLIEPQDAGSQAIVSLANAEPGMTVLDYCAGAGGKTLALAAQMKNSGELYAHDSAPQRLSRLDERARRAGATITAITKPEALNRLSGKCDAVLVDAPCSGSGSWRRDPMGKWRLTEARLKELVDLQHSILRTALDFVRPGGTLTYATCSILHRENEAQTLRFLSEHPEFIEEEALSLWPARDGTDGFFATRFKRR